jgi:hypothetical protein
MGPCLRLHIAACLAQFAYRSFYSTCFTCFTVYLTMAECPRCFRTCSKGGTTSCPKTKAKGGEWFCPCGQEGLASLGEPGSPEVGQGTDSSEHSPPGGTITCPPPKKARYSLSDGWVSASDAACDGPGSSCTLLATRGPQVGTSVDPPTAPVGTPSDRRCYLCAPVETESTNDEIKEEIEEDEFCRLLGGPCKMCHKFVCFKCIRILTRYEEVCVACAGGKSWPVFVDPHSQEGIEYGRNRTRNEAKDDSRCRSMPRSRSRSRGRGTPPIQILRQIIVVGTASEQFKFALQI